MLIGPHRVPVSAFDQLSHGYADAAVMGLLRAGRLSKHMLLIRAVLDAARSHPRVAATAGLEPAVALLDQVQRHSPLAAEVVSYPLVGAWAADCLRRLRHPTPHPTPLWVDLGHLAAVAAVAGIRAGAEFTIAVPMRQGWVSLPGLGRARLCSDAGWGVATLRGGPDKYTVEGIRGTVPVPHDPATSAAGWDPVHTVTLTAPGRTLLVAVDDIDPYRSSPGLPAADRLDPAGVAGWRDRLAGAWELLVREHSDRATELAAGPIVIVPAATGKASHTNATARDSPGAMTLTLPRAPFHLALSMVHELQHTKLGALLDLVPLYEPEDRRRLYSPWRADPRPIGGLLQGVYAFLAVTRFWHRYAIRAGDAAPRELAEYEFARVRGQVRVALRDLSAAGAMTEPGRRFLDGLREALHGLDNHPVGARPDRLARLVRADHRLTWRLRNLAVDPPSLDPLVAAWRAGASRPADPTPTRLIQGAPGSYGEEPRHRLARRLIEGGRPLPDSPDAALLAGDYLRAAQGYRAGIATPPGRLDMWSGLALARRFAAGAPAAYWTEPEVLAALHKRLTDAGETVDPDALASWLSR